MRLAAKIALVLGLALLTSFRAHVFHTNLTLWTDATAKAPDKPRPAMNLAAALINAGELQSAEVVLARARELAERRSGWEHDHGIDLAIANLAVVKVKEGKRDEALVLMHQPGTFVHVVCQRYGDCAPDAPR